MVKEDIAILTSAICAQKGLAEDEIVLGFTRADDMDD